MPSELQPETEYYSKVNKWNTFIVNLNGIKNGFLRNGHSRSHNIPNGAATDKPTAAEKDISPPYIVAHPSFEMGWPRPSTGGIRTLTNGSASSMTSASAAVQIPAFQLTSHKQLEHADQIDTMEEERMKVHHICQQQLHKIILIHHQPPSPPFTELILKMLSLKNLSKNTPNPGLL